MVGGVRRNASTAAECICPTAVCNRSIGREFWTEGVRNVVRIRLNSGQVGPHKRHIRHLRRTHFGYFSSHVERELICTRQEESRCFPNCTALNHRELPPPLLQRRGQSDEHSGINVTEGNDQPSGHPPATAGMIETPAPAGVAVSSPCSNRTSSSLTYTLTNRRSLPWSSRTRAAIPVWFFSRSAMTSARVAPSAATSALPPAY